MSIAIIGSRNYSALEQVREYVRSLPPDTILISGGASGVDQVAEAAADEMGFAKEIYQPEYGRYPGKLAPLKRNATIVGRCESLTAFWDGQSKGTLHTIHLTRRPGKEVVVYQP